MSRNGAPGTVLARKILVDLSTDTPAVLAYVVAFDDGRRLTVKEAVLDSILESMSVENVPDLS